jgi:2-oxoglutarate ferredoxin oxidoreductase subunit alpha
MTATAGPGISLMSEFVGLGYFAEIPVVIFDVQRMGPSTGLPTRTSQGDLFTCATLSHGDSHHPLLIPCSPEECFQMGAQAFDIAEELQTPVFVMLDLDLGMNHWMADAFPYPEKPINRGKMLTPDALKAIGEWGRYKDVDGDGVPYRTVPGDGMPAYFARGSGHNGMAEYSERANDYVDNMDRLALKYESARKALPQPVVDNVPGARIGLVDCGTSHWAVSECRVQLLEEADLKTSYLRLRAFPFTEELGAFIDAHDRVYVVEQNRDAQLLQLMRLEFSPQRIGKLRSVLHYDGLPIDARSVSDELLAQEGYEVAKKTARIATAGMTVGGQD